MNEPRTYSILYAKAALLSNMGYRIKMWQFGELWCWEWNNGLSGFTDAQSKEIALVFALESV
jgi:hypothetical protein